MSDLTNQMSHLTLSDLPTDRISYFFDLPPKKSWKDYKKIPYLGPESIGCKKAENYIFLTLPQKNPGKITKKYPA